MSDEMTPYEEGRLAAEKLEGSAADCPYLPGTQQVERSEWLDGFSKARPAFSRASDPAHADDPQPARPHGQLTRGYKEG